MDNVNEIRADHNAGLEVEGIVINQFQARASLPQQIINELREEGLPVLASFLSSSVKIKESHQQAKPMIHLDRSHKVTLEFAALFDELEAAKKARAKAATKKRA
jgi:chromosome partitioning protein